MSVAEKTFFHPMLSLSSHRALFLSTRILKLFPPAHHQPNIFLCPPQLRRIHLYPQLLYTEAPA